MNIRHLAAVMISLLPAAAQAIDLRPDFPESYRIKDPDGYTTLAALYRNAPRAATINDFFFLQQTSAENSRWGRRNDSNTFNPNQSKCTMLGRYGETPSQPFTTLYANRVQIPSPNAKSQGGAGPLVKPTSRDFVFLGILTDGKALSYESAAKLRDTMGWSEERDRDLVIHAQSLPGYYNTPINIFLRKNGDFVSFCMRESTGNSGDTCEPNSNSSPGFSHKNIVMYGYCYSTDADPTTAVGDLTEVSPSMTLSGAGNEAAYRKVIGRYGNNYYVGRSTYMFTDRNMDLEDPVRYTLPADDAGPIKFSISSNANLTIHGYPVYPIDGHVIFRADSEGQLSRFLDRDTGRIITLDSKPFRFYITESDDSFENRKRRAQEDHLIPPTGRFFAIADWSFGHQDIRFYEMTPSANDPAYDFSLKAYGSFHGDSRPANIDYYWK